MCTRASPQQIRCSLPSPVERRTRSTPPLPALTRPLWPGQCLSVFLPLATTTSVPQRSSQLFVLECCVGLDAVLGCGQVVSVHLERMVAGRTQAGASAGADAGQAIVAGGARRHAGAAESQRVRQLVATDDDRRVSG